MQPTRFNLDIANNKPAVVVTGVSSGIGLAIARRLCEHGYVIFGSVRSDEAAKRIGDDLGERFRALVFDVTDRAAVSQARRVVDETLGERGLSALVNNAGLGLFGPLEHLDDEKFEDIIGVNLFGARNVTNAFLPLLRRRSDARDQVGRLDATGSPRKIINISSLSGILNTPMNGAYCVSKHALESLGETYRRELMPFGIDVVSIRSGPIESEIWNKNIAEDLPFQDTPYAQVAMRVQGIMRKAQRESALPADVIAKLVQDIIEGRKRRTAYELGEGSKTSIVLSRYLPTRMADRLIHNALTKKTRMKTPR